MKSPVVGPRWGAPPWRFRFRIPSAPLPRSADAVVIGAGFAGLAAARSLAAAGLQVVVLEGGRVGGGASGRSGGVVLEGAAAGELPGLGSAIEALRERIRRDGIECGLELPGCLELAHRERAEGPWRERGWRDAGRWLVPAAEVPGGTLDPGALLSGMAAAATRAGARIHEGVRASRLRAMPAPALETTAGGLSAGLVVVAAGAFTGGLVPEAGELHAALTPALVTAPLPRDAGLGPAGGRPFYTVDLPYLWGRPLPDGALMLGAGLVRGDPEQLPNRRIDRGAFARAIRELEDRLRGLTPRFRGLGVRRRFAGPVCFRTGAVPLLCLHPESPRVALAGAFAGHGVALAPLAGELAAEALLGRRALPDWGRPCPDPAQDPAARSRRA